MEFGVLGPLLVRDAGREVPVGGIKRRALLCALLLRPGVVVPAERLIADLWAEPPAPATLTSHIAHLRRVIGAERVVTRPPGYALEVRPEDIDAVRFEADLAEGRAALAKGAAEQAEAALARGLALWRGPALADVRHLPWAAGSAARLDELRTSGLEARLEARLGLGRSAEVVGEAEAALTSEPLRERLWGLLMLGLYREGRQHEALDTYQRLRRVLAEELGMEPGPAVRALQAQMLTHDPVLDLPPRARPAGMARTGRVAVPVPARLNLERSPFVGRSAELELLERCAEEVVAGGQRIVLLSGEPGAGKTRLCARFSTLLSGRGWGAVYGRCEDDLAAPYRPWAEALAHLGPYLSERLLRSHVEAHGTDAVLVAPALVTTLGRDPTPRAVEGAAQPGLVVDAAVGLLGAVAGEQPLLCVLDDLQWADEATLLLLRHLAQGAERPALLVLAVCQDTALPDDHPLRACVTQLQREDGFVRLRLGGLSVEELAALAALERTEGDARVLADRLHRDTGGNPFYAIELLRHGCWLPDAGVAETAAVAGSVPDSVASSIGWRCARLGEGASRVLKVAAVVGQEFTAGLVAAVLRVSAEHVLDALEAAEDAALVRLVAGERFAFAHGLIRQSLYGDLGPARRARLHRMVAEALSALPGADAAERARHWLAGAPGDVRAMAAAEAAGDAAMAAHAYADAVTWYARAVEELDRTGPGDPRTRADLLVSLGTAHRLAGSRAEARDAFAAAAEAARELGEPAILARAALGLAGYDRLAPSFDPAADVLLREALDALGERHDRLRVALCARLATHLPSTAVVGDLAELAATAVELAAGLDEAQARADGLCARLHMLAFPKEAAERLDVTRQLTAAATELGDVELALVALDQELSALVQLGEFGAARAALARYAEEAGRVRIPQALAFAAHQEGFLAFAEGRFADEAQVLARLETKVKAAWHSELIVVGSTTMQLTPARWLQGRLVELRADLAPILELFPPTHAEPARMLLDAGAGDLVAARARLDTYLADPGIDAVPRNALWCPPAFELAAAGAVAGTAEHARELIRALAPCAGLQCSYQAFVYYGAFDHHLGVLQALAGDEEAAVARLEAALRQHQALGARPWIAVTEHALGRLLRRSGDAHSRARGRALLASAGDAAKALGMASPARLVEPTRQTVGHSAG